MLLRCVFASVVASAVAALVAAPAGAGVGVGITPSIPSNLTAGETGIRASIRIANLSANAPGQFGYDTDQLAIQSITFVASCGSTAFDANCPGGSSDPGVLVPSLVPAMGAPGTACANRLFTFTVLDPSQGKYAVTPSGPVTLGATGARPQSSYCIIEFTFDVSRTPRDASAALAGFQTEQKAAVTAVDVGPFHVGQSGGGVGTSQTTISRAQPTIAMAATPALTFGAGVLTTLATVSGLASPVGGAEAGTVEFRLYGPDDASCETPILTRSAVPPALNQATTAATAGSAPGHAPTSAGTYGWRAFFGGDANNDATSSACGAPGSTVVVHPVAFELLPPPPPAATAGASSVASPSAGPAARDRTSTKVLLGGAGAVSSIAREVSTRVACPASEAGGCSGSATFTLLFRNRLGERRIALGAATFALRPGAAVRLTRKLTRAQLARLRGGSARKLRVQATSRDAAGNVAKSTRTSNLYILVPAPL